ncbi:MAG: PEP/pyruvate-binding domain-containing protein, partial [Actinomycetota bacterium]
MVRSVTTHRDERARESPLPPSSVLWLDDERAVDPALVGAKAANLALAARHGLPTLPGFVLTTAVRPDVPLPSEVHQELRAAWERLVGDDDLPLVVRSSSTVEDTSTSSMAGQFTSILGVRGWEPFCAAVGRVLGSARHPHGGGVADRPMGVLVQRELPASCGGVLFGLDPVAGDRRHVVVEVVCGSPDALVSGRATAAHLVLGRHGRLVSQTAAGPHPLRGRHRRRLAHLARAAELAFGGPQDVEWALDEADRLWLLQARAVTAAGPGLGSGPILGPGPVAETFPDPLSPLEVDLWVTPLREGVARALHVIGAVGPRRIERSPVVTAVGGRVAVDLDLFHAGRRTGRRLEALNPVPTRHAATSRRAAGTGFSASSRRPVRRPAWKRSRSTA